MMLMTRPQAASVCHAKRQESPLIVTQTCYAYARVAIKEQLPSYVIHVRVNGPTDQLHLSAYMQSKKDKLS